MQSNYINVCVCMCVLIRFYFLSSVWLEFVWAWNSRVKSIKCFCLCWYLVPSHCMKEISETVWRSYGSWPLTSSPSLWCCFSGCRTWRKPPKTGSWDRPLLGTCTKCLCRQLCRALGHCRCDMQWRVPASWDYSCSSHAERKNESKLPVFWTVFCVFSVQNHPSFKSFKIFSVCFDGSVLTVQLCGCSWLNCQRCRCAESRS